MADPITLATLITLVVTNAPSWFAALSGTVLDKGREAAVDKGKDLVVTKGGGLVQRFFRLEEREQLRHIEQALKNATERGLAQFETLQERDQYKDILRTLSQPGPLGDTLRREILHLFMLAQTPDLVTLSDTYNQRKRYYDATHQEINAGPYLTSFFNALVSELYADPYFRPQLSDILQQRAAMTAQQALVDIFGVLKQLGEKLAPEYSIEDFERDKVLYTAHMERTLHNIKVVGVVPKDQNTDPELSGVFVPLRIAFQDRTIASDNTADALVEALEQYPCLVVLGGPGSGKSTATRHLAWSHAVANQDSQIQTPLLSGRPLPLRIELRRISEERKKSNYDFLSFVTEVLLRREGVEIDVQMFKELLARRCMLLLFDGLDEVTTLDERLELVNEIEHFALTYPGNRVLVTSRPVGYELAPISHPLFKRAEIQGFDDNQIQQFLENWYTSVLKLSPIPQRERDELNELLEAVKQNPRLHRLAENPLLLTVLTQLHRYERLPDRRVLVYDRCADLLLETWARLRGTHERWRGKGMKMGKEDQYACVAYLGFVLHTRSQQDGDAIDDKAEERTVDVPSRFLRKQVEEFLEQRELIMGGTEQRNEAALFIDLIQEEAGLIVERGTDENGEPLYSFVHRTFQEYFAAADVYERYQQDEDPTVISAFLRENLHDPHWLEVILLLLGKLKSKPVTNQLTQILEGKVESRCSVYTQIIQQDLFFVADCLIEEIKVESKLVSLVVEQLVEVAKYGMSPSQQKRAIEYLGRLARTQQYKGQGLKLLLSLVKENTFSVTMRLKVVEVLYLSSAASSKERDLSEQALRALVKSGDLPVERVLSSAETLYVDSSEGSQERQVAQKIFINLLELTDLPVEQIGETARYLYKNSIDGSQERRIAQETLISLLKREDLLVEQVQRTAKWLYRNGAAESQEQQLAQETLISLLKRDDLSVSQTHQVTEWLYGNSLAGSQEHQIAQKTLIDLLKRENLSVDQAYQDVVWLYELSAPESPEWQVARGVLLDLLKRRDLSVEQVYKIAKRLYQYSLEGSEERQVAQKTLILLVERDDLSIKQIREVADWLCRNSPIKSGEWQVAWERLIALLKREDIPIEYTREIAMSLYGNSPTGSEERKVAWNLLQIFLQRKDLSAKQILRTAEWLYGNSQPESDEHQVAREILLNLLRRKDLSVEQVQRGAAWLYRNNPAGSYERQLAREMLLQLLERTDLLVDEIEKSAEKLYNYSLEGSKEERLATEILLSLILNTDEFEDMSDVYYIFTRMVPQFDKLRGPNMLPQYNV